LKEAGAEPDQSWCIGEEKRFPDLVLEIALSSGGLPKLEIYGRLGIPEVWLWRKKRLEVFCLTREGQYESLRSSRLLPGLDLTLLQKCVGISDWLKAMDTFHRGLEKERP
jgi:Uma2 family endonuclease